MSKNTADFKFRKVDVDQFNEDNFVDEVIEDPTEGLNESEILRLLNSYPFLAWIHSVYFSLVYLDVI